MEEAALVIEGSVSQGIAHGDGVIRENTIFDLLPRVSVQPNFSNAVKVSAESTPATFRFETKYSHPFVPETTPLPNPDGYPPVSFIVYLWISPSLGTQFPPLLGPPEDILNPGIIVDVPIVAYIDSASIVLSGTHIVPEPHSIGLVCCWIILLSQIWRELERSQARRTR